MKKLLLLLLFIPLISCSDSEDDCNCVKTWYYGDPANVQIVDRLSAENVSCQDSETQVTTSINSSGSEVYYYVICCDNLDNISNCD